MATIGYISGVVGDLTHKTHSRDPFGICDALGVRIRYKDLGTGIKAYYFCQSRIRNIILNNRVSEMVRRVLVAHELGHDRLHREVAMLKGFQEIELFDMAQPSEYEANLFAAELLIDDQELLELLNAEDMSFFGAARALCVPADLLDFKFRAMKHKGYRINVPLISNGSFLKNKIDECFEEDI